MCDYYVKLLCAGKFGLGWAHDVFKFACHMFMHTYLQFSIFLYIDVVGAFMLVSLSPFLFLSVSCFMATIWKSTLSHNPFHFGASSSFDTTSHVRFRDDKARRTFRRTFLDEAFIRNAKLSYRIFSILTFPLSSTIEVGSHYVASWSLVPLWSYRSFIPTCTDSILLFPNLSLAFGVCAL